MKIMTARPSADPAEPVYREKIHFENFHSALSWQKAEKDARFRKLHEKSAKGEF